MNYVIFKLEKALGKTLPESVDERLKDFISYFQKTFCSGEFTETFKLPIHPIQFWNVGKNV